MKETCIECELRGRVQIIRMRRPDHGNRVSQKMAEEMIAALGRARQSGDVSACVLTGYGDVFCLGGDYQGAGPTSTGRLEFARAFIDLAQAMARLGKPVIAAVNGDAHAGGFSLVVACDMAIVAKDATLGLPEAAKGLFPFLALAIVKDALPKKVLFDVVYGARLMDRRGSQGLAPCQRRNAARRGARSRCRGRAKGQCGESLNTASWTRSLLQHAQHELGAGAGGVWFLHWSLPLVPGKRIENSGRKENYARYTFAPQA